MSKICYIEKRFSRSSRLLIAQAVQIIDEYVAQGFVLTLRQLYYQFVSRDFLPNTLQNYKRLGSIINDARLVGLIDWESITDRTRNLEKNSHWANPSEIIESAASSYKVDLWEGQPYRPEVWIEKDALIGVIEGVCTEYDVPYFSCWGYTSQSEMWKAAMRLEFWRDNDYIPYIIHLGDHDPSGMDMTHDISKRLALLSGDFVMVNRIALTIGQVREYNPPPNPAKATDARYEAYQREFGQECWELDALEPQLLASLIKQNLDELLDSEQFEERQALQDEGKAQLGKVSDKWNKVQTLVNKK